MPRTWWECPEGCMGGADYYVGLRENWARWRVEHIVQGACGHLWSTKSQLATELKRHPGIYRSRKQRTTTPAVSPPQERQEPAEVPRRSVLGT
jgi:hypothetical protein